LTSPLAVIIFDDESNGHNHNGNAVFNKGCITQVDDLSKIETETVDYVIHLAAAISVAESMTNKEKYMNHNIAGSKKVFAWAMDHGVKHVVAASSAAIYGDSIPWDTLPNGITENLPYGGLSPYADSKYKMEKVMRKLTDENPGGEGKKQFCATGLRFFNVYGPRQDPKSQYSGVISIFMQMALDGNQIGILGDGEQTRDFVYVKVGSCSMHVCAEVRCDSTPASTDTLARVNTQCALLTVSVHASVPLFSVHCTTGRCQGHHCCNDRKALQL
jgi:nucleoside-diphosphate-sugar epimerase